MTIFCHFLSNIYYLINRKYHRQVNWWVYFSDTYASSIKGDAEMSRYQEIVFGLYNFNAAKKLLLTKAIILFMTFQRHWLWNFKFGDTNIICSSFQRDIIKICFTLYEIIRWLELFICLFIFRNFWNLLENGRRIEIIGQLFELSTIFWFFQSCHYFT